MDTLKQVEIVKGPASSIYGSNAIGGVVAFTTKDPSDYLAADGDDTAASIKTSYHSTDEETSATLSLANRTGNLESMLVYTRREGHETENMGSVGGTGTDRTKPNPEDNESDNLLLKLQYQINDAHRIGFTLEENNTESEGEVLTGLSRTYSKFDSSSEGERSRFSLKHEWNADLPLFDTAESTLSYQKSKKSNTSDQLITSGYGQIYGFTSPSPAPLSVTNEPRIKDYSYEEEQKQFNAVFTKKMENQTITYGVNVKETEFTSVANTLFENFDDDITRWSPLTEEFTYGVFIQNQITLLDGDFTLTPSIRYDSYETDPETDASFTTSYSGQKHNKTSFRLGSVYKINDNLSVFAQYAQGFKTPDLEDLYQYFVNPLHRYVITGNPNLKPEESDSYEIGVRYSNQVGELEVTAFYNDYEDYIEEISYPSTDPGQPGFTINQDVNIADANIRGLEVRGSVWLDEAVGAPSGTSLKVAIAYARGEGQNGSDADDVPLSTVAPLKGVIGLNYDAPNDFWGGSIDWTLVDQKEENDLVDADDFSPHGYGIVDLSAYVNVTKNLVVRANVNNLTDKKYFLYDQVRGLAASTGYIDRYTQPGRNFNLSATYSF